MRACRGLCAAAIPRSTPGKGLDMQSPLGTAQTQQWSWILQTVWGWIWAGLSWIVDWQAQVFHLVVTGSSFWEALGKFVLLFFPATVLVAGVWGTMVSLYTIPFRSGRGRFLAALLMSWWDAVRMAWFYWFGLARFLLVFVGWIWGLLRLGVGLLWRTLKNLVTSPFAMLDSSSRQPGVPWIAFVLLLFWSAIEATIFTFTLRPTMSELLADLTGYQVNGLVLVVILWFFLFIIIGGSFACIQVLNEAIKTRAVGQIVAMVLVEITVALFEVLFLYRELIDAITPWLAQQGFQLGIVGTLGLALLGWVGVRGMTWFLFGRFGTPALLAILGRKAMEGVGAVRAAATADAEFWKGPINALKAEHEWFKKEAQHLMELLTLPVLQLVASGFNFLVVVIMGKPHFALPFRSLDQVLHSTPIFATGQAKVFHPIQDLSGKTPAQIAADLRAWFPQEDPITDFNAFFQRAALHVKRNNLVLAPLNVVLFSDGEPDYPGAGRLSLEDKYKRVDLSPLEYLSRNVTVRLLYADPPIAQLWENKVPRKRVRLWTQDSEVMKGWRRHMVDGAPMQRQDSLWSWVDKVVDVRVRRERVI